MKVTVLDAWQDGDNIAMKYRASIPNTPDTEGVIVLPVGPAGSNEMEYLQRAMVVIRNRMTSPGPVVQGLMNIIKSGKPVDDNLDPEAPPAAPDTKAQKTK